MAMITTVQQHILQQQQEMLKATGREARGPFRWLLSGVKLAAKVVEAETGKYIIVFDPLDGSSNIDVNVNVGTIFSVLRRLPPEHGTLEESILQQGFRQVAAGYVVYGPSTVLVYTTGNGVHGFTLDSALGAFGLSNERMRMPEQG